MALIGEEVVEEWLRQQRYFTIRGIRRGNGEIDILAVQLRDGKLPHLRHVEVHAAMDPISHVTPWTDSLRDELKLKGKANARKRTAEQQTACIKAWIANKFENEKKRALRELVCPGGEWEREFVVNKVKWDGELKEIGTYVKVTRLKDVLADLKSWAENRKKGNGGFTASGAPLIDLMLMLSADKSPSIPEQLVETE
jgi:hypothetical protein